VSEVGNDKQLIGMVHLPPLPGAPRHHVAMHEIEARAVSEARILHEVGFDACIVENFGDAPFHKDEVEPVTVAAMARVVAAVRRELPEMRVGVNVLRNDARAALAVAVAADAHFIRVNVHVGATATDQGVIEGRAADTVRARRAYDAPIQVWADVHVKHGRNLSHESIVDEARDAVERGLANALIFTGSGTGRPTDTTHVETVSRLDLRVPLYVGSGVTRQSVASVLALCDGIIVGSALKTDGRAESALDPERARRFVEAARQAAR
jgi:membrane complex biogenesis BtpA family protein